MCKQVHILILGMVIGAQAIAGQDGWGEIGQPNRTVPQIPSHFTVNALDDSGRQIKLTLQNELLCTNQYKLMIGDYTLTMEEGQPVLSLDKQRYRPIKDEFVQHFETAADLFWEITDDYLAEIEWSIDQNVVKILRPDKYLRELENLRAFYIYDTHNFSRKIAGLHFCFEANALGLLEDFQPDGWRDQLYFFRTPPLEIVIHHYPALAQLNDLGEGIQRTAKGSPRYNQLREDFLSLWEQNNIQVVVNELMSAANREFQASGHKLNNLYLNLK